LGSLESRELLSSLPIVPSPAAIHVEKGSGRGSSGTGGSSIGTLQGTASLSYDPGVYAGGGGGSAFLFIHQEGDFAGTGSVKPFGRVAIAAESILSVISGAEFSSGPESLPPTSLEGPIDGAFNFTNAEGRVIGSITLQGDSWSQFTFQERRSGSPFILGTPMPHGRVIASGTGTLTFPEGEPTLTYNSSTGSPPVTVPFTITL
jgi:hypothetical protein